MADAPKEFILSKIRKEKEDFRTKSITLSPGYAFNQHKTLQRIEAYSNSRFYESPPYDEDGFLIPFLNVNRKPRMVAAKEIDLDTKDILVRDEGGDMIGAQLMAEDLKQWMKNEGFAAKLNEYADEAPTYGTVVVKKVKDELHTVDLLNLVITNVSAKDLKHTDKIELHRYSADELSGMPWDAKAIREAITLYQNLGKSEIEIDERRGWVKESEFRLGGREDKYVYTLAIVAGAEEIERAQEKDKVIERGIVLFHELADPKDDPYREWHFMRMKNRWLGLGWVEILFDNQVRANEMAYFKAKGLRWTSLHLFTTDDETVSRNLLADARDGDVIKTVSGRTLTAIANEERNLAHFISEERRWDLNTAEQTFTPDVISGEGLPSGTPARSAIIADTNVKKFYDRKREDFGIFVRSLIYDDVLPLFMKQSHKAHMVNMAGSADDRDKLQQFIFNARMEAWMVDEHLSKGKLPSLMQWNNQQQIEMQRLTMAPTIDMPIPEGYYKRLKPKLEVVITKENEDTDAMIAGRKEVLMALGQNPNIAVNPLTRSMFLELARLLGVKNINIPNQFNMAPMGAPQGMPPGGAMPMGGAAKPVSDSILSAVPV